MPIKITGTTFEALVQASEVPKPLALDRDGSQFAINPMVFKNDWSVEVGIETSWQTDVTRSLDGKQDRWILLSRPLRKVSARFIGGDKAESEAILNALTGSCNQFGFPFPIYPDAVSVGTVNDLQFDPNYAAFTTRVYGDFRYKRFFRGGRVAFMDEVIDDRQNAASITYATVIEVAPSYIKVAFNQGDPSDLPERRWSVVPCVDVEMSESSSGVAETDGVFVAEVQFTEVEGASALPASWPAVTSNDPSNALPLCDTIGELAVFPFDPDWSAGVDISVKRRIEQNRMGRTSVQDPNGESYLSFGFSLMGYGRQRSWDILRFFDAMRGRAAHFYFRHPMQPWSLEQSLTTMSCRIAARGNASSLAKMVRYAVFKLDGGGEEVRKIDSISEVSGLFQLTWTDPVVNYVSVQPIFICTFSSDTVKETWATDGVLPGISFEIEEDPSGGAVTAKGSTLGFTTGLTGYAQVPGCTLLLRAGSGCFDNYYKPAEQWPSLRSYLRYWEDSSQPKAKPGSFVKPKKVVENVNTFSTLLNHLVAFRNNGQPSIANQDFRFNFMTGSEVPIGDRHLWDADDGWTLCMCFTPGQWEATPVNRPLFSIESDAFSFGMDYDYAGAPTGSNPARARVWNRDAGPFSTKVYQALTTPIGDRDLPVVVTVRLAGNANGRAMRVWVNGEQATVPGASHFFIVNPNAYSESRWMHGFNFATPIRGTQNGAGQAFVRDSWTVWPMLSLIASWNRGLADYEINQIHDLASRMFLAPMTPSALY